MPEFEPIQSPEREEPTGINKQSYESEDEKIPDDVEIKEFEIEGAKIRLIGVPHETDHFWGNKEFYEREIKNADVLLLESMPEQTGYNFEQNKQEMMEYFGISGEEYYFLIYGKGIGYYVRLADLAQSLEKPAAVVDPIKTLGRVPGEKAKVVDQQAIRRNFLIAGLSFGFLFIDSVVLPEVKGLINRLKKEESETGKQEKKISRRGFLRGILGGVGVIASGSLFQRFMYDSQGRAKGAKEVAQTLMPLAHDLEDYRNVVVAEGLNQLAKIYPDKKITVFYGKAHPSFIERYAKNDSERELKLRTYGDMKKEIKPSLSVFSPEKKGWQRKYEIEIK